MTFTIKDVAARAGVGLGTASRVINGAPGVSPATRSRVLAVVEELGYRPNRLAQVMVRGVSQTLGVIVPDISNPFFALFARGVEDTVRELGYVVMLSNTDNRYDIEQAHIQGLADHQAAGIILAGEPTGDPEPSPALRTPPIVTVDRDPLPGGDSVHVDNRAGSFAAVEHLTRLGHRRIGYVALPPGLLVGRERFAGYRQALLAASIDPDPDWVRVGDFRFESGHRLTRALLARPAPVAAIYAGSAIMALGVIRALPAQGRRVPEEVAVVAGTGLPLSAWVTPALTAVELPAYELGMRAAEMLLDRLDPEGDPPPPRRLTLSPKLIIRDSCGAGGQRTTDTTR